MTSLTSQERRIHLEELAIDFKDLLTSLIMLMSENVKAVTDQP